MDKHSSTQLLMCDKKDLVKYIDELKIKFEDFHQHIEECLPVCCDGADTEEVIELVQKYVGENEKLKKENERLKEEGEKWKNIVCGTAKCG